MNEANQIPYNLVNALLPIKMAHGLRNEINAGSKCNDRNVYTYKTVEKSKSRRISNTLRGARPCACRNQNSGSPSRPLEYRTRNMARIVLKASEMPRSRRFIPRKHVKRASAP